jgi:pimeloyl-ACP methyl ester carboxylesterase
VQSVRIRGEDVPLTTFGEPHARPLLFLHGYARHPLDYRLALEEVARRGWRVHAPFLFANHRLRRPPRSFWASAALGRRTLEALISAGRIPHDTPVFGHSTGGAVALSLGAVPAPPPRILAVNPVQPSERHVVSFVLRSGWMNTKLALGIAGDGRLGRQVLCESGVRFYANWLRDPRSGLALIEGLTRYSYPRLERWFDGTPNAATRARVLYGAGDEFYPASEGLEAGLARVFAHLDVRRLADENSHEWLMIRPTRLADEVQAFLEA